MEDFIVKYYDLLTNDFKGINLTRITDFKEFKLKQIDDSIEPYKQSQVFRSCLDKAKCMVDIGFGGGFPILPMAKICPETSFIGIETRGKKVKVVAEIAKELELKNVVLKHERIENILINKKVVCTFKAVGKVADFLNKINTTEIIQVFFYKGPNFYEIEYDQLKLAENNWNVIEEIEIELPGVEKRYLIGFENKSVATGRNNLVKLSDIN